MQKIKTFLIFGLIIFSLVACSEPVEQTPTPEPSQENVERPTLAPPDATLAPTNTPTEEFYPVPAEVTPTTSGYPAPTTTPPQSGGYPAPGVEAPAPIPVTFSSSDGTQLVGTFYPPLSTPAPVVVLMHQFGSDQHQWDELASWLQTGTPPEGNELLPAMQEGLTFAVLTFDFRGHGESEGTATIDSGILQDAQSAIAFVKTQSGVDPLRIITIGTSIGADAAVDACVSLNETAIAENQEWQGCVGAMSLSPGSFIEVNYTEAANAFLLAPHQAAIYCLATEGDGNSLTTCNSVSGDRYRATIFAGNAHGVGLLDPSVGSNIGNLILEFLIESLQQRL